MSTISLKLTKDQIKKIKEVFKNDIKPSKNEYIDAFINRKDLTISIYHSDKVVFQGNDAFFYAQDFIEKKINRQAGSDEVGTGDFFGPVCVCACIVEKEQFPILEKLHIVDSKQLNDEHIIKVGPTLIKEFKHSLLIVDNKQYNKIHEYYNLNAIKAKLHNKAYINLLKKGYDIPKAAYVDQFAPENLYYNYLKNDNEVYHDLIFETKAETKYPAVACASVIARYAFLLKIKEMENKYKMVFHKGADEKVDNDTLIFIQKYGKDRLNEVCKLHFANYKKTVLSKS